MRVLWISALLLLLPLPALAEPDPAPAVRPELGQVAWLRDHDAAFDKARAANKPVFVLFQEVPG